MLEEEIKKDLKWLTEVAFFIPTERKIMGGGGGGGGG